MKKAIIGAILGTGMLLASSFPAYASTNMCTNDTTGALSHNYCKILNGSSLNLGLNNSGVVNNNIHTTTNTGKNNSNYNTDNQLGGTGTGNAGALVSLNTSLNTNSIIVGQNAGHNSGGAGGNSITGYNSHNTVTIDTSKSLNLGVTNEGTVNNNVHTSANSGNNTSNYNTIGGSIVTGDASAVVGVNTTLNSTNLHITQ